ncbi:MAG: PIN domain-containing protein [Crocosphaera sp.]
MKDKHFFDTNIFIYSVLEAENERDKAKNEIALSLIEQENREIIISNQVLNEVSNILLKKSNFTKNKIIEILQWMLDTLTLVHFSPNITLNAVDIVERYQFSFYDSLIISSAIAADCDYLITEDLQENQIITYQSRQLKVINPFTNT